jgi:purine nucleosidase
VSPPTAHPARKVILDCDPGHDDAMAILLAAGCSEIELVGITTVAGNQTLDKTTLNAQRVCTLAGITGVPICAGCDRPLVRPLVTAGHIHGTSGLDGPDFGPPEVQVSEEHAVDFIVRTVMESEGDITLVPVGPLTNLAVALRREPRIAERVAEVVLMGGSAGRGNYTPAAEFNIFVDPEAAAAVFGAGWPLTMVGLDLTRQAGAGPEVHQRVRDLGPPVGLMVADMLQFLRAACQREHGVSDPPVHDPCAVARVARPGLVEVVDAHVAIEVRGEHTAGMTVTDFRARLGPANSKVALHLDHRGFWDFLIETLARFPG